MRAEDSALKAAYLLDPVDASSFAPESPDNPAAAKALAASGKPAGITGAGVQGSCNPAAGNYAVMYAAAGKGSWQVLLPGASHAQFGDAGAALNVLQDLLCGQGKDSRAEVAEASSTPMLAWFWQQLSGVDAAGAGAAGGAGTGAGAAAPASPMPAFFAWVERQQRAGLLAFKVKGGQPATPQEQPFGMRDGVVFPILG